MHVFFRTFGALTYHLPSFSIFAVEIKHGRISQLAFLGQIVTRGGVHLGGNIDYSGDSFDSFPNGVAALIGPDSIPTAGLVQIIAFIGLLECGFMRDVPGNRKRVRRRLP